VRVLAVALAVVAVGSGGRVGDAGVTVVLPAGWHTWSRVRNLSPNVTDPVLRVVAISAPFRFAAAGCQVASFAFPRNAVAIVVVEWLQLGRHDRWRPRPARFAPTVLPLNPAPAIECFNGPGGGVEFADHGRHFGAYLMAGRAASPTLVSKARTVLDTLRVTPR